jgi:uncharacterized membrane protein
MAVRRRTRRPTPPFEERPMSDLVPALTLAAAVSSAVLTGVLFAFSTSVMPALAARPQAEGMAAMQAMNRTILNPIFGLLFGGSALLCFVVAVSAPFTTDQDGAGWRLAGGALYVIGVFIETMVVNVPMNDRLDAADASTAAGHSVWADFLIRWTRWNNVRTLLGVVASTFLVVSLVV